MAVRVETQELGRDAGRSWDVRKANDRIAEKAEQFRFVSRVPMMCECSAPACQTLVMIGLPEYWEIRRDPDNFIVAPGHLADRAEPQDQTQNYDIWRARPTRHENNGDPRSA